MEQSLSVWMYSSCISIHWMQAPGLEVLHRRGVGDRFEMTLGGFITMPGIACYCWSKFVLEGISDTLSKELKPFGIAVTAVAPGSFRTDWTGRSMHRSERSIAEYDATFDPIRSARQNKSGKQLGDPVKAARAMLMLIDSEAPPAHLLLGSDALQLVRERLEAMTRDIEAWGSGEPVLGRIKHLIPFGCEAVVMAKSGLYLTLCSHVLGPLRDPSRASRTAARTLPQVYHRPEERIS